MEIYAECPIISTGMTPEQLAGEKGISGENLWNAGQKFNLFDVVTGDEPALRTEVRMFFDRGLNALCLRFYGEDDGYIATMNERDDSIFQEDVFELFITSEPFAAETLSERPYVYYEFETSPTDVKFDAIIRYNASGHIDGETSWNLTEWRSFSRYRVGDNSDENTKGKLISVWVLPVDGWLKTPEPGDVVYMNLYRIDRGSHRRYGQTRDEYSAWRPTGKYSFHRPEAFGGVRFKA